MSIFGKCFKGIKALGYGFKYPSLLKEALCNSLQTLYGNGILKKQIIPLTALEELSNVNVEIKLQNCNLRDGNVSLQELLAISIIIANNKPKNLVEIGTFDGNTTLQMALNAVENAIIHTIDIRDLHFTSSVSPLKRDLKFIEDKKKSTRKFLNSSISSSIIEHIGDSTTYDFSRFTQNGLIDFCFIDGGHSYECVKSDTEKLLPLMAPNSIMMWHDCSPFWPDVYKYLCELSKTHSLIHIEGTALAYFKVC